jgi:drug/metabolite transporter (DMT)-like permease
MTAPLPAPQTLRAALWMLGAVASFSSMAVAGRAVSLDHDTFEIMLYRSIVGFLIVMIVARATGHLAEVRRDRLGLHALRNLSHFTGQNLWFLAITLIPLAQVFALEFTSPLWVLVLSPLVLGERMTRIRVLAATLGFVGIGRRLCGPRLCRVDPCHEAPHASREPHLDPVLDDAHADRAWPSVCGL